MTANNEFGFDEPTPVLSLVRIGDSPQLEQCTMSIISHLDEHFRIITSMPTLRADSTGTALSSGELFTRIEIGINAAWVKKVLWEQPAVCLFLGLLENNEDGDDRIIEQISIVTEQCSEFDSRSFATFLCPDMLKSSRKEKFSNTPTISGKSVYFIQYVSDLDSIINNLKSSLVAAAEKFYRRQIKSYTKAVQGSNDYQPAIFTSITLHCKLGFCLLFVKDYTESFKEFSSAYTLISNEFNKLSTEAEFTLFFDQIKWVIDVIFLYMVWILVRNNERIDADRFVASHIYSYSSAYINMDEQNYWKASLYNAVADILLKENATSISTILGKHLGYYYRLAASHYAFIENYKEMALELYIKSYDVSVKRGHRRTALSIARSIAILHKSMGKNDISLEAFIKLHKAYLSEGWPLIMGNILKNVIEICQIHEGMGKIELESYFEYASLFPEKELDSFDAKIQNLVTKLQPEDSVLLDMAIVRNSLVSCIAAFNETFVSVDENCKVAVVICNMSPLSLAIASITVCFSNQEKALQIDPSDDILPGKFLEYSGNYCPTIYGPISIESVTVDLLDLPLRLFFPVTMLTVSHKMESFQWKDSCRNMKFIKLIREKFPDDQISTSINPIRPEVKVSFSLLEPLTGHSPCPVELVLENTTSFPVITKIWLSSNSHSAILDQNGNIQSLNNWAATISCQSKHIEKLNLSILYPEADTLNIRLSHSSKFDEEAITKQSNLLSPEEVVKVEDLSFVPTIPFEIFFDITSEPTREALEPTDVKINRRIPLVQFSVNFTLKALIPVHIGNWTLTLKDQPNVFFNNVSNEAVDLKEGIIMELNDLTSLNFLINSQESLIGFDEAEPFWHPILKLDWSLTNSDKIFPFLYELPPLSPISRCIFIIPQSSDKYLKIGRGSLVKWIIWNMSGQEQVANIMVKVEANEDFVYTGVRQTRLTIPKYSAYQLKGSLIPLKLGRLRIPSLNINSLNGEAVIFETLACSQVIVNL